MTTAPEKLTFWDHESRLMDALIQIAEAEEAGEAGEEPGAELQLVLKDYVVSAGEKRDRMAGFLRSCENRANEIHQEIFRLQRKQKALENASQRIKDYVVAVMEATGSLRIEGVTSTLSLAKNPPRVVVEGEVEPEFRRIIPAREEPDKAKLRDALEAGRTVVNARLVEGVKRLVIR